MSMAIAVCRVCLEPVLVCLEPSGPNPRLHFLQAQSCNLSVPTDISNTDGDYGSRDAGQVTSPHAGHLISCRGTVIYCYGS